MQTVSRSNFITVKTEGAILPADLLQRIAAGDLDGLQSQITTWPPTKSPMKPSTGPGTAAWACGVVLMTSAKTSQSR